MLDEMFKNLKKKTKQDSKVNNNAYQNGNINNISTMQNNLNNDQNKFNQKHKEKEIEADFLDEFSKFSDTKKSEEILKKYCTLYAEEEMQLENNFSSKTNNIKQNLNNSILNKNLNQQEFGKYAIKPLTHEYQIKKQRREENLKTTGKDWFDMQAPEMTPELKEDLKALQLKSVIDPSRFYKKSDAKKLPKFFQVGRIVENITDGKKHRLRKSEVKNRLAEEILEADLAKNYTLRKFEELQGKRRKLGVKKMKINKYKMKNKKFAGRKEFVFK